MKKCKNVWLDLRKCDFLRFNKTKCIKKNIKTKKIALIYFKWTLYEYFGFI